MRFFVPSATDSHQSEDLYQTIRQNVANGNQGVSDRRIYQLKFRQEGRLHAAVIGSDVHGVGKGPVVAIFEGLDGYFYVCTQDGDVQNPQPHPVHASDIIEAQEFSALA